MSMKTEDSIVLEFDTLGLSQKTFIGDEPKKEFDEVANISVRKTKFSLAFQNMLKKKASRSSWTTISKLVFDITMKAREEVRSKKKVDKQTFPSD